MSRNLDAWLEYEQAGGQDANLHLARKAGAQFAGDVAAIQHGIDELRTAWCEATPRARERFRAEVLAKLEAMQ